MNTPHRHAAATDPWLAQQHRDFLHGLTERLDLGAGLREVQLPTRHSEMVNDLRGKLDLDAGLAAILPPPATVPELDTDSVECGSPLWAASELSVMPLPARLAVRAHFARKFGDAGHVVLQLSTTETPPTQVNEDGVENTADTRIDRARLEFEALFPDQTSGEHVLPREHAWFQMKSRGAVLRPATDIDIVVVSGRPDTDSGDGQSTNSNDEGHDNRSESRNPPDSATTAFAQSWTDLYEDISRRLGSWALEDVTAGGDPGATRLRRILTERLRVSEAESRDATSLFDAVWVSSVRVFVLRRLRSLASAEQSPADISASLAELADQLFQFEQLLNDFTGADLRDTDLHGISLEGLRWSGTTTQWPELWREQIEHDSVQIDDDVFEIHYGTKSHQDTLV